MPTIEIRPVASTAALDQAVEDLAAGHFDWVVLTSVNGVAAVRARSRPSARSRPRSARPGWPRSAPRPRRPCATGASPRPGPRGRHHAALGQAFPPGPGAVLLARADLANPELAVILRDKAWRTTEVVAYHTVPVGTLDPAARRRLDAGEVDWVAFTASSTVEGFLQGYGGPPPPGVRVAAIGPVTADTARAAGIRVAATATEHTIPGPHRRARGPSTQTTVPSAPPAHPGHQPRKAGVPRLGEPLRPGRSRVGPTRRTEETRCNLRRFR